MATAGLVATTTTPAAAEPGAGVSTGSTNINVSGQLPAFPLCLKATSTVITLHNTGSFSAAPSGSQGGLYVGTTTATFSTSQDFYFSPAGTFSDEMCTTPAAVSGSLSVVSTGTPTSGTSVACNSGAGGATYNRVNTNAQIATTDGSCLVNGGASLSSALVFAGSQQPCLGDFPVPDPCTSVPNQETEWVGTYIQA